MRPDHEDQVSLARGRRRLELALATFESDLVMRKARRYAIDVPNQRDRPTWWATNYDEGMPFEAISEWLTPAGRVGVSKLIREERRRNIEWWVKIITPILGALISLMGLLVALVTVVRRN